MKTPEEDRADRKRRAVEIGRLLSGSLTVPKQQYDRIVEEAALGSQEIHGYLDRISRLAAENAALREIAQAVASGEAFYGDNEGYCCFCDGSSGHAADCPVTRARALLAKDDDPQG